MQASRLRSDIELPTLPEGCAPSEEAAILPRCKPSLINCEGLTFRDLMRLHGLADSNRKK